MDGFVTKKRYSTERVGKRELTLPDFDPVLLDLYMIIYHPELTQNGFFTGYPKRIIPRTPKTVKVAPPAEAKFYKAPSEGAEYNNIFNALSGCDVTKNEERDLLEDFFTVCCIRLAADMVIASQHRSDADFNDLFKEVVSPFLIKQIESYIEEEPVARYIRFVFEAYYKGDINLFLYSKIKKLGNTDWINKVKWHVNRAYDEITSSILEMSSPEELPDLRLDRLSLGQFHPENAMRSEVERVMRDMSGSKPKEPGR